MYISHGQALTRARRLQLDATTVQLKFYFASLSLKREDVKGEFDEFADNFKKFHTEYPQVSECAQHGCSFTDSCTAYS
jgi:hypothetical protein